MDADKVFRLAKKMSDDEFNGFSPTEIFQYFVSTVDDTIAYEFLKPKEFILFCFLVHRISNKMSVEGLTLDRLIAYSYIEITELDPEVECDHCDGSGEISCSECSGSGNEYCDECGGSGNEDCDVCDGTGEDEEGNTCWKCDGDGSVDCEECVGSGKENCTECNGSGEEKCFNCDDGYITKEGYYSATQFFVVTIDPKIYSDIVYYEKMDVLPESLLPSNNINSILVKQDNHSPCDDIEEEIETGDLYFIGSDTDTNISMYKTHRGIDIADIEDIC